MHAFINHFRDLKPLKWWIYSRNETIPVCSFSAVIGVSNIHGSPPQNEAYLCFSSDASGDLNSSVFCPSSLFSLVLSFDALPCRSAVFCCLLASGCSPQSHRASACWAVFSSLCSPTRHKVKVRTWARLLAFQGQQGLQGWQGFHLQRLNEVSRPQSRDLRLFYGNLCTFQKWSRCLLGVYYWAFHSWKHFSLRGRV